MGTCSQTEIPVLNPGADPCNGEYTSTNCIIHTTALTALGIPINSPLSNILVAIVAALNNQNTIVNNLTEQLDTQQTLIEDLSQTVANCCL